jgi:hypothetical protein
MPSVTPCAIPPDSLLASYKEAGAFVDCYTANCSTSVSLTEYVTAFYTTPVFKLERFILKWAVNRPSSDTEAGLLATGATNNFAAWNVEARADNQLLMTDINNRTRSWLMVAQRDTGTRLYFGSAVVPVQQSGQDKPSLGFVFTALLGFHKIYSQVLLNAARTRLQAG